jgi:hypothetical protein
MFDNPRYYTPNAGPKDTRERYSKKKKKEMETKGKKKSEA